MRRREALGSILGLVGLSAIHPPKLQAWLQHVHLVASPQAGGSGQSSGRTYRPLIDPGTPKFFSEAEMKTLSAVVEQIIPTTDTPGASAAGVHWYLDMVAETEPELQTKFREGLALVDSVSRQRFQKLFSEGTQAQQVPVLEWMMLENAPGNEFFTTLKVMTIVAYYSSEIGLYQELQWPENVVKFEFLACPHGGHSIDDVGAGNQAARAAEQALPSPWPSPTPGNFSGEVL
jgi:hypothetical protein